MLRARVNSDHESYFQIRSKGNQFIHLLQKELKLKYGYTGTFDYLEDKLTAPCHNSDVLQTFSIHGLDDLVESLPIFSHDLSKPPEFQRRKLSSIFKDLDSSAPPIFRRTSERNAGWTQRVWLRW